MKNNKVSLEQIYNFIYEIPGFSKKSNLEMVKIFYANIQDSNTIKFNNSLNDENFHIYINGKEMIINLIDAPKFLSKNTFINWVFNKIS